MSAELLEQLAKRAGFDSVVSALETDQNAARAVAEARLPEKHAGTEYFEGQIEGTNLYACVIGYNEPQEKPKRSRGADGSAAPQYDGIRL